MRLRETAPAWVVRQMDRRAARYADDKVVRWIAFPSGRTRTDESVGVSASSNDNIVVFARLSNSSP